MRAIGKMLTAAAVVCLVGGKSLAQYVNLEGNNPSIQAYVEAAPDNWNRPIFYVFYNGDTACESCPRAIEQFYRIYQNNYADSCSIFEINYADDLPMQTAYELDQPLSIVIVRVNDGMSHGYYKIDNPQNWLGDLFYFDENITTQINNFLQQ